jgi:glycine amidinotransferase
MCKPDPIQKKANPIVNSWNEWDTLKHVIVGVATGTVVQAPEPAVQRNFPDNGFPYPKYGRLPQELVDKANEELDGFARILQKRGINVDRPIPLDFSQQVSTPDWVQGSMFGCMPPRDCLLTVGNEILEATMSYRSRWFEYLCYRPLLEKYFEQDPHFRMEAAPKPRLDEHTYHADFWEQYNAMSEEEQIEHFTKNKRWATTEAEILFDAADVGRYGRDLFVQRSLTTNGAGLSWLRRHFPNHRVHEILFNEADPVHIDATFIPLRPGLALVNPMRRPLYQEMLDLFRINDWQIIEAAPAAHDRKSPLSYCSVWLSMNTLMLDEKTICVEEQEVRQMEQLDKLGFEVIPVPFWDVNPFGGGLHCATADVCREGTLQDYFPRQVEGY